MNECSIITIFSSQVFKNFKKWNSLFSKCFQCKFIKKRLNREKKKEKGRNKSPLKHFRRLKLIWTNPKAIYFS